MARLSTYRRILEQDFPENADLVKDLGITINSSFEELYNALNNRLTFKENFNATIQEFTVTVDVNGTPRNRTTFKLANGQQSAEGLIVINVSGASDPTSLPNAGVFVSFVKSEGNIIIQNIKGLPKDVSFKIKVIVLG